MNALPPAGTLYCVYARYSTTMQDFKSIEDQISLCRDYAQRHGWIEAGIFYDAERSGTTLRGRGGFFNMMAAADRGEFTIVLSEDLDRLSRTASSTHGIVEELEALDIVVCTVSSGVVTDMEVAFKATQNSRYVKGLAEKTRRGQEGTVKAGRISGRLAYGYRKKLSPDGKNGYREIDPAEAGVVRRIFKDYVSGVSIDALCRAMNQEGIPGPKGKPWRPGALRGNREFGTGILRNKLYRGLNEWGRSAKKHNRHKGTSKAKPTPVTERLVIAVPELQIVDDDLFDQAQALMESRRNPRFYEQRQAEYLLSGLCYCGKCGAKYATLHDKLGCTGRALNGLCDNRRRVHRDDIESAVLDGLRTRLLTAGLIEPYLAEYRAEIERAIAEQAEKAESGAVRLKDIERQKANVLAKLREGHATGLVGQVLMEEIGRLETERQRLERQAKARPRSAPPALDSDTIIGRLHAQLDGLREALAGDERDAVRARDLVRGLLDRVVITPIAVEHEDKRGIGPVRITVEGRLAALLDLADEGRVIQHTSRTETILDHASLRFSYYVDFVPLDVRLVPQGYADLAVIARVLDDADAPVSRKAFIQALAEGEIEEPALKEGSPLALRVRHALDYLLRRKEVRSIAGGPERAGWVWNHIELTDEQWKARAAARPSSSRQAMSVLRVTAPEAHVVVIGNMIVSLDSEE